MSALDALFWVVCLVLAVAGASKVADPAAVAPTLRSLGLGRSGPTGGFVVARVLGVAEIAVAAVALSVGGRLLPLLVAAAYVAFAVIVVVARSRGLASCGCFGASSAPPSAVHVVVDVGSAAVALGAAATGAMPAADGLADLGATGVLVAAFVLLATALVVVVDTTVADVVEATRALREQETIEWETVA